MSGLETLIVATWGDPARWKLVEYHVEVPTNKEVEVKRAGYSRSTLAPLLKAFWDRGVKALVLASETLAALNPPSSWSSESVRQAASEYLNRYLGMREYSGMPRAVESEVLPGVGVFQVKGGAGVQLLKIVGSPHLYAAHAYVEVLKRLLELRPKKLLLDVSHGINYMPLMAYRAVVEAAYTYTILEGSSLNLIVYNSDPVLEERQVSTLHIVEQRYIKLEDAVSRAYARVRRLDLRSLPNRAFKMPLTLGRDERGKHGREVGERRREFRDGIMPLIEACRSLAVAASRGLILYLAYKASGLGEKRCLKGGGPLMEIGRLVENRVIQSTEGGSVTLTYPLAPGEELVESAVCAALAIRLVEEIGTPRVDEGFKLSLLEDLARTYVVESAAKTIVSNELSDVKSRVAVYRTVSHLLRSAGVEPTLPLDRWIPYTLVYLLGEVEVEGSRLIELWRDGRLERAVKGSESLIVEELKSILEREGGLSLVLEGYRCNPDEIDRRNFYAHAGLERSAVKVYPQEDPLLAYYEECFCRVGEYAEE